MNRKPYAVTIEVYRKGTYKIYSLQLENDTLEVIKFSTTKKITETLASKTLSSEEAKAFADYIRSFPVDNLKDEYRNRQVKGEHHLKYHITVGDKHKDILVYFEEQDDLKLLYKKLMLMVPAPKRFWYYAH